MGNKWPTLPLEEMVENIFDRRGVTPTKLGSDFISAGHRVISAKLIKGSRIDLSADEPRFVNAATYKKWMSSPLQEDDVIMTSEAPLGELAWVRQKLEWCLGQRLFGIRTDKQKLNGRFLFYALQSETVRNDLISRATGTTVTGIRQSELRKVAIPLPPLAEQKRISGILGALDDKIELNRQMNETLEQMARALFKSWFVDFDPVHAKAAGRQPAGMDKATADLFPNSFVDSESGKIPSGWKAGSLSELSEFSRESINPGESPSEIFDHYSLPSFDEGKAPKPEAGGEIKSNKLVVTKTCVLLSKLNPHIPRIWLPNLHASRRSICSTEFIVASAMTGCTREYLYALFISEDFSRTYGTLVTGTTGSHQRIRAESVLQMRLPIPPAKLISSFTDTIAPMLKRVASNTKESQTLAELRDTLLPQLLNGDLKVA